MNTVGFTLVTSNDQSFTVDRNVDDFLVAENSASSTQRKVSMVPFVGSISPEGFLSLILLLVVIIATVVVTLRCSRAVATYQAELVSDGADYNVVEGTKIYWGSNSSDGGNIGDGVKIAGGEIGSGGGIGVSFRYGLLQKDENTGRISSFLEFSEKSEKMFPGEARFSAMEVLNLHLVGIAD
ncbi:hypothetical protein Tco_0276970 [Tanacetum coccineum]